MSAALLAAGAALLMALGAAVAALARAPRPALRVLMYHRVTEGEPARDAIPVAVLERQIAWLRGRYLLVTLRQVLDHARRGAPLPPGAVLLTFDDGTDDAARLLGPLLQRLGAPAALFAVPAFAGQARQYGDRPQRFCDAAELRALARAGVAIGLHGWAHDNLSRLLPVAVEADVRRSAEWLRREGVPFEPALAFPYGAFPRQPEALAAFHGALRRAGVELAFRIGNRVNAVPLPAPLLVQRTEIRGDESFLAFRWRVRAGRLAPL